MWPFRKKAKHPPLELVFVPSLVSVLLQQEQQKGSPLTEAEVLAIRDRAAVIALPAEEAAQLATARGYADIRSEECWRHWVALRTTLHNDDAVTPGSAGIGPIAIDAELQRHYEQAWGNKTTLYPPLGGRTHELPSIYSVIEFAPDSKHSADWIYATSSMSSESGAGLELFIVSAIQSARIAEILDCVAHFHITEARLDLHHIVNLGEPWAPGSACTYAYLSLPYSFGPALEWLRTQRRTTRCLWLVPITASERQFALARGINCLEELFESAQPNLANPTRASVANESEHL